MLYIRCEKGIPVEVSDKCPGREARFDLKDGWSARWDWVDMATVTTLATYLTALTGKSYLPVDNGPGVSPRYDVTDVPQVGDDVSYSFNGDTYPCGTITKITPSLTIVTSTGARFRRYKQTGGWRKEGGTWWLVKGTINERNPHL
jgi:hypothetical protein